MAGMPQICGFVIAFSCAFDTQGEEKPALRSTREVTEAESTEGQNAKASEGDTKDLEAGR
jgi:hypothetical protein